MGTIELLLLAIGLSMDAFAVSVTNGLYYKKMKIGWTLADGLCFGLFQGAMPTIGFFLGKSFSKYITAFDHIIALVMLGFIGGKMIYESFSHKDGEESSGDSLNFGTLMVQGVATSIDALAVGVSFAALQSVNIVTAALFICCVTFLFSIAGVVIGKKSGTILNTKAELIGGLILVGIGVKIFVEHVFFGG